MKQVKIKIRTTQTVDGESETLKTLATGTLEATPDAYVLNYLLTDGEGNTTPTRLTVDKHSPKVVMEHTGRMVIEANQTHTTPYQMGPYQMELGVHGKQVICRLDSGGGNLKLCYDLTMDGMPAGETAVELFVQS